MGTFAALDIWKEESVKSRLSWYFDVSTNRMPAKYLICRRIEAPSDVIEMSEGELWMVHEELSRQFHDLRERIRRGTVELGEEVEPNLLTVKVELTKRILRHCYFCRWYCKVDRTKGEKLGTCQLATASRVSSYFHHRGEELPIRGTLGSGTIFFTSCNMRCAFCLHPDTLVLADRGLYKIEEIFKSSKYESEYGDGRIRFPENLYVYAHDGRRVRASKVFRHEYKGDLISIKPLHAPPVLVTPSHEIPVYDLKSGKVVKVRASEIELNSHMLLIPRPKREVTGDCHLDVYNLLAEAVEEQECSVNIEGELMVAELDGGGLRSDPLVPRLRYRIPGTVKGEENSAIVEGESMRLRGEEGAGIPLRVKITKEAAELFGYYCARGHVSRDSRSPESYKILLEFDGERWALVERSVELFKLVFGIDAEIVSEGEKITVEVNEQSLAPLFSKLCGTNARDKRVPDFLVQSDRLIIESFLNAIAVCYPNTSQGDLSITTISKELAAGLCQLMLILGYLPRCDEREPIGEVCLSDGQVGRLVAYEVRTSRSDDGLRSSARYRTFEDYILVPIENLREVHYQGPVYNLEVEDEARTYVANCIAVGNCQNSDISHDKDNGVVFTPRDLSNAMWLLRMEGCHNINLVGGEPTIHLHTIVEAISMLRNFNGITDHVLIPKADYFPYPLNPKNASYRGEFNVPILWNSNMFMSRETLLILRELVDIWLPDFKFGNDKCAIRLSRTPWYFSTVSQNHKTIYEWGEDIVIRHLIMPGHVECCTKPVLKWIAENMPGTLVNVMDQYHPDAYCNPSDPRFDVRYKDMARYPTREEIEAAYRYARDLGLNFEVITFEKSLRGIRI